MKPDYSALSLCISVVCSLEAASMQFHMGHTIEGSLLVATAILLLYCLTKK